MASTDKQLSSRYAKAFLQALNELGKKDLNKYQEDIHNLKILTQGETGVFFQSPLFEENEKKEVLEKILNDLKVEKETKLFVYALNLSNHVGLLEGIAAFFTDQVHAQQNKIRVEVKTAYPLQNEQEERIAKIFSEVFGQEVLIEKEIDSSLIGGITANVGGRVYDASIKGYLNRLQKQF